MPLNSVHNDVLQCQDQRESDYPRNSVLCSVGRPGYQSLGYVIRLIGCASSSL